MNTEHRVLLAGAVVLAFCSTLASAAGFDEPAPKTTRRLWVPFDHGKPEEGSFLLQYEFGRLLNPELSTVFVIADGQQLYVRPDRMADIQEEIFGPDMNVVGIIGRGTSIELLGQLRTPEGNTNWVKAYRYLKAEQWIEDIEAVRRELLGSHRVHLYGRGGGAFLIHQVLARYGDHVERVFSQAAATPYRDAELGIEVRDSRSIEVDEGPRDETEAIAARIRMFELYLPTATLHAQEEDQAQRLGTVAPGSEVIPASVRPLLRLYREGAIPTPAMDFTSLQGLETEVLVLAGHRDHTTDRRSQASLAARYPLGILLLVDDNHTFSTLEASGLYPSLVQNFLKSGRQNKALKKILEDLEGLQRKK